ncbi:hypothetical protein [Rhodococcus triatomae]
MSRPRGIGRQWSDRDRAALYVRYRADVARLVDLAPTQADLSVLNRPIRCTAGLPTWTDHALAAYLREGSAGNVEASSGAVVVAVPVSWIVNPAGLTELDEPAQSRRMVERALHALDAAGVFGPSTDRVFVLERSTKHGRAGVVRRFTANAAAGRRDRNTAVRRLLPDSGPWTPWEMFDGMCANGYHADAHAFLSLIDRWLRLRAKRGPIAAPVPTGTEPADADERRAELARVRAARNAAKPPPTLPGMPDSGGAKSPPHMADDLPSHMAGTRHRDVHKPANRFYQPLRVGGYVGPVSTGRDAPTAGRGRAVVNDCAPLESSGPKASADRRAYLRANWRNAAQLDDGGPS